MSQCWDSTNRPMGSQCVTVTSPVIGQLLCVFEVPKRGFNWFWQDADITLDSGTHTLVYMYTFIYTHTHIRGTFKGWMNLLHADTLINPLTH